ncbi:MAG: hypothetical protein Q9208_005578 [Pyrenodesmia sp. 3 TL-2023]
MLLKLSALVVVASVSVSCLAPPPVGGSGLAARENYAAAEDANPIASALNDGQPDDVVNIDLLEPADGPGQDAVPNVEGLTVSDEDSATTDTDDHELDARKVMCANNCSRGLRAARGPNGKCHCEPVKTGWHLEKRLLDPNMTDDLKSFKTSQSPSHEVRAPEEFPNECPTVRCSEGYHGALDTQSGQCTCVQDGFEKRENRDYIIVDQQVARGPSHSDIYSQKTAACDSILQCDKNHVPEERFNAKGESQKQCWCAIKTATGARTGAPPPSTGPGRKRRDVNGPQDTQSLTLDAQVQDGLLKRGRYSRPTARCDGHTQLKCLRNQHREERLSGSHAPTGVCCCASGSVLKLDGSGQCSCVPNEVQKRVSQNIVFDHSVHSDPAQSGLLSMPTARCNAKKPACGKNQTPMEHFYGSGQPTGVCWCQPKMKKRQDYNECPNIRCATGWVPEFDGSDCYCALGGDYPYTGTDAALTGEDEENSSSGVMATEGDAIEEN